jgi:hypothetical protein
VGRQAWRGWGSSEGLVGLGRKLGLTQSDGALEELSRGYQWEGSAVGSSLLGTGGSG